jgi:hypothetical protein
MDFKEAEPCEDAISRQVVSDFLEGHVKDFEDVKVRMAFKSASSLVKNPDNIPSVTPARKKGHWIMTNDYFTGAYGSIDYVKCSCCGGESLEEGNFCPNCGAEMGSEE